MGATVLLVLLVLLVCSALSWEHATSLHSRFELAWTVHARNSDIIFEATAQAEGYVALGLVPPGASRRAGMPEGSDLAVGWVNPGGEAELHDYHVKEGSVILDRHQDWQLVTGSRNATHTVLQFRRKLDTCDPEDVPITNDTAHVLWAYHHVRPQSPSSVPYHGQAHRGASRLLLMQPRLRLRGSAASLQAWEVVAANVTLSDTEEFTYSCTVVRAPLLRRKHHAVKVEPILPTGGLVRHIKLFQCLGVSSVAMEQFQEGQGYSCHSSSSPPAFSHCEDVFAVWARGASPLQLPDHVGIPLVEIDSFFLLEVLFHNPDHHQGPVSGRAGLRIYYSSKLRKFDTAVLALGALPEPCMVLPPGVEGYKVAGHADPQCLSPILPSDGIRVYAGLFLTHSLARQVELRHFMGDKEFEPLLSDRNFDPDFMEYRIKDKERRVHQNDHLVVECTYDTRSRVTTTFGGFSAEDERCLAFLLYYPRVPRSQALSCPSVSLVAALAGIDFFNRTTDQVESPSSLRGHSWQTVLRTYRWPPDFIRDVLQPATLKSPHRAMCNLGDGGNFEMVKAVSYPELEEPYQRSRDCVPPTEPPPPEPSSPAPLIKNETSSKPPRPTTYIPVMPQPPSDEPLEANSSGTPAPHIAAILLAILYSIAAW